MNHAMYELIRNETPTILCKEKIAVDLSKHQQAAFNLPLLPP